MKVLIEGEVIEKHDAMFVVRVDNGYGSPEINVAEDKAHKLEGPSPILGMMMMRNALLTAEHDLTTHGGLISTDVEGGIKAGTPTFVLDTKETLARIDAALKQAGFTK